MTSNIGKQKPKSLERVSKIKHIIKMKTKEQELDLLVFQEISDFEKNEVTGGRLYPWDPEIPTDFFGIPWMDNI